jgi:hypothetical protein
VKLLSEAVYPCRSLFLTSGSPAAATRVVTQSSAEKMSFTSACGGMRPGRRTSLTVSQTSCSLTIARSHAAARRISNPFESEDLEPLEVALASVGRSEQFTR